jgi:hypothetical protein
VVLELSLVSVVKESKDCSHPYPLNPLTPSSPIFLFVLKSCVFSKNETTFWRHCLCVLKIIMQLQPFSLDHNLKKNMEIKLEVVFDS